MDKNKQQFNKDVIMSHLNDCLAFSETFKAIDKDNLDVTYDNVSAIIVNAFPKLKESLDFFKSYYDQYVAYPIAAIYADEKSDSLNLPLAVSLLSLFKLVKHYHVKIDAEGNLHANPIVFGHLTKEEAEKLDQEKAKLEMIYYRPDQKIIANKDGPALLLLGITQTANAKKIDTSSINEHKCRVLMDSVSDEIIKLSGKECEDLLSDIFVIESLKEVADANIYWMGSLVKNQEVEVNEIFSEKINFQELVKKALTRIDISNELIPIILDKIIYDSQNQFITFNKFKPIGIVKGKAYFITK